MVLFFFLLSAISSVVSGQFANIAGQGTATQIDDWNLYTTADNAIDGNANGHWSNSWANSVTATSSHGTNTWWKLTFPTDYYIDSIDLYNRLDHSCDQRIDGIRIFVDDTQVATVSYVSGQTKYSFEGLGVTGSVVTLWGQPDTGFPKDGYINLAEVAVYGQQGDITCTDQFGDEYEGGDSYVDDNGKTCTCRFEGLICMCEGEDITCPAGTSKWTDQNTCEAKCIKDSAYCYSSGDPHYRTFDGKYYDFHGQCTYQAASCEDFVVNFKNVDLYGRAPRFTGRAELVFNGMTLAIANGYTATVNGVAVQVPYVKTYTNGDKVEILNNGQLEIVLYQVTKGRMPAVRIRATNAGSYIQAELWLHGSCADVTEGMCGNWNGNSVDDLVGGSAYSHGITYQKYDENCPDPDPDPFHACDLVDNGFVEAAAICDALKGSPFSSCHASVSIGNEDSGVYKDCMTDVCNCFLDQNCACSQYDSYASSCINAGIDLADWRESVAYCPYDCPEDQVYMSAGSVPAPTCIDRSPDQEGTARGCFCPSGQFLQDNECVAASSCRCLYEGLFYNNGDEILKDGECESCICQDAGEMVCQDLECPALECADNEIEATKGDVCCPYCESDWVKALNPEETVKGGQNVALTCEVHATVKKQDISWYKDGAEITEGVSKNKLVLKISDVAEEDAGDYTCSAEKDGKVGEATFDVEVVVPSDIVFDSKSKFNCKENKKCKLQFKVSKTSGEDVGKNSVKICKLVDGSLEECKNAKYKRKQYKVALKKFSESDAGEYVCVVTENGKETISDPVMVNLK